MSYCSHSGPRVCWTPIFVSVRSLCVDLRTFLSLNKPVDHYLVEAKVKHSFNVVKDSLVQVWYGPVYTH